MTSGPFMPEPRLARHDQPAAQRRRERHAAEAADHARDHRDHRHVAAQRDDRRVDLRNRGESEVRLLQPHAARLEQQHRPARARRARSRAAPARAPRRSWHRIPRRCCRPGRHPRSRRRPPLAGDAPARHHHAVVRLRHDILQRQPRRLQPSERPEQLAERARIEDRARTLARRQFDEASAARKRRQDGALTG